MSVRDYNIHDIVTIQVKGSRGFGLKDLNSRFSYFTSSSSESADISVEVGPFSPDKRDCYSIDHKYFIRDNYIYFKDATKKLSWELAIQGIVNGPTHISFQHGLLNYIRPPWCFFPNLIFDMYILTPILEHKFFQAGYSLLHAGAIEKNGKATLIVGRGGALKTAWIISMLNRGFNLVSDDFVLLNGRDVLSLPTHLGWFQFCQDHRKENISSLERLALFARLLHENCPKPKIVDRAEIERIILLLPVIGQKKISKRPVEVQEAVRMMLRNQYLERYAYLPFNYVIGEFLDVYNLVFPGSCVSNNVHPHTIHAKLFDGVECSILEIPHHWDVPQFDRELDKYITL